MPLIELTQGRFAEVDLRDKLRLKKLGRKWQAVKRSRTWYAAADIGHGRLGKKRVYLHRWIMGVVDKKGVDVDHINGDGLDNRRCNLRVTTHLENCWNRRAATKTESGYRGVRKVKAGVGWAAYFKSSRWENGKQVALGTYETAELAACARDYFLLYIGLRDYAKPNFLVAPHSREAVERGRTFKPSEHPNVRFKDGKWEAYKRVAGRRVYVGRFSALHEAQSVIAG